MIKILYGTDGKPLKSAKAKRSLPQGEPLMETTHAENLAARKFLTFMLDDIKYQLQMMAQDTRVAKREFDTAKTTATVLANYLTQHVEELDRVIAIVENNPLDDMVKLQNSQPASDAIN